MEDRDELSLKILRLFHKETMQETQSDISNPTRGCFCGAEISQDSVEFSDESINYLLQALLVNVRVEQYKQGSKSCGKICGTCAISFGSLVNMIVQLEAMRHAFNELRRQVGHKVIRGSLREPAGVYEVWLKDVMSVENVFPSGAIGRLQRDKNTPDVNADRSEVIEDIFSIKEQDDEEMFADEPFELYDFHVNHLEKLKTEELEDDAKLSVMTPVVILRRLKDIKEPDCHSEDLITLENPKQTSIGEDGFCAEEELFFSSKTEGLLLRKPRLKSNKDQSDKTSENCKTARIETDNDPKELSSKVLIECCKTKTTQNQETANSETVRRILRPRRTIPGGKANKITPNKHVDNGESDDEALNPSVRDMSISEDKDEFRNFFANSDSPKPINFKRSTTCFTKHTNKKSKQRKSAKCSVCKKRFNYRRHAKWHMQNVHPESEYKVQYPCRTCYKEFDDFNTLKEHEKTVHYRKTQAKYECPVCMKQFMYSFEMKRHMVLIHPNDNSQEFRQCPVCQMSIDSNTFQMHLDTVHSELKLQSSTDPQTEIYCSYCDLSFSSIPRLRSHQHKIHSLGLQDPDTPKCPYCLTTAACPRQLRKHLKHVHRVTILAQPQVKQTKTSTNSRGNKEQTHQGPVELNVKIYCSVCHRIPFSSVQELETHAATESHRERLKLKVNVHCNTCRLSFCSDTESLQIHLKSESHGKELKSLGSFDADTFCIACRVDCGNETGLREHNLTPEHWKQCAFMEELIPNKIRRKANIKCHLCPSKFTSSYTLRQHLKINHKQGGYTCEFCGKEFTISRDFMSHRKAHKIPKPFLCAKCGVAFETEPLLNCHTNDAHSGESLKCPTCGKVFKSKGSFAMHKQTQHLSEGQGRIYPCPCSLCPKQFQDAKKLRRHKYLEHPDEYLKECKHVCLLCFHVFATLDELTNVHMAAHDALKCPTCGKYFQIKTNLENHVRTHTGEKPFACKFCDKTFGALHNLTAHMKRHKDKKIKTTKS